jgi:hypothetical protein
VGTLCSKVKELDWKAMEESTEFDLNARIVWKKQNQQGIGSINADIQELGRVKLDKSFIGVRIEYLSEFDMDTDDKVKQQRWCSGVIEEISDGTWLKPNARTQCWNKNEAARVYWDPIPDANINQHTRSTEPFVPNKWNQDCVGAWRKDYGDDNYGL